MVVTVLLATWSPEAALTRPLRPPNQPSAVQKLRHQAERIRLDTHMPASISTWD